MVEIVVLAKSSPDVQAVKIDPETNEPVLKGVPAKVSDFDRNAAEEALRLKAKLGGKVKVLTAGPPEAKEQLRQLVAMGADEAYLATDADFARFDYSAVSRLLAAAVKKLGRFDLILCGEASIDLYSGQMGPRLAGLLGIPSLSHVRRITAEKDRLLLEREMGDAVEEHEAPYPVLVSVNKEINEPRLPNMMQIIGASRKPITEWKAEALGLSLEDIAPRVRVVGLKGLVMKRKNVLFSEEPAPAAQKLVDALRKEGVLGGGAH